MPPNLSMKQIHNKLIKLLMKSDNPKLVKEAKNLNKKIKKKY